MAKSARQLIAAGQVHPLLSAEVEGGMAYALMSLVCCLAHGCACS